MSDSQPAQEQNAEPSNNYQQDLTEKKEASKQKTLKQIAREREEMDHAQRFGFFSIPYPSTVGDQAYSQNKEYENHKVVDRKVIIEKRGIYTQPIKSG